MRVLDPPPPSYPTFPIFSTPFRFSFTDCVAGELPDGNTAEGCFAGHNETGAGLEQSADHLREQCGAGEPDAELRQEPSDDIFSNIELHPSPDGLDVYSQLFEWQCLHNGDFFFITEDGVDPPRPLEQAQHVASLTPEPASIVLLSTGALLFGCLLYTVNGDRALAYRCSLAVFGTDVFPGSQISLMHRFWLCLLLLLASRRPACCGAGPTLRRCRSHWAMLRWSSPAHGDFIPATTWPGRSRTSTTPAGPRWT